jgi:hypothetical protein
VKSELLKLGDVTEARVQLQAPQATISMQQHIPIDTLQAALSKAGNYTIVANMDAPSTSTPVHESGSWLQTYKPILLIFAFITGITLFIELSNDGFYWNNWMANFMAGFFLVFSFFKLLDLRGFADSYATYDIIAKRWHGWGLIYPFIELALGLAFMLGLNPIATNGATFVIMGISIIGVLQSLLNKRRIQCACLGAVFNLPMSTITVIEDGLMIAMSGLTLTALM